MFRSFDLWYKYFEKLVTAIIPDPDELDEPDNIFIQLDWEEHFGSSLKVYERNIHFLVFWLIMMMVHMLMIQMMMIWILTGFPKCLNMALSSL